MMAGLSLLLLGTFQAALDGAQITSFESDKVRALLAYLAVESDRLHRRETLAGLLWPDMAERDARTNLRQALANLRKVLGDRESAQPFINVTRQTIQFNDVSDAQVDVRHFTRVIEETASHAHDDLENCQVCISRLQEAVQHDQGEFLEGFSLDSDLFEEWMVVQRERLHIQVLDVLDHLAAYHEKTGDYSTAQRYGQQQVELEPWRESAHRQLMRAYALSGQRGMALAQYEVCKRVLEAELGIEPEIETTHLYKRILSGELLQELSDTVTTQVPEPDSPQAVPQNLPTSLISFVGRENLLDEITTRLCNPECRLLTLVGPGGSGKTRLALEVARGLMSDNTQECFSDGLFFVPLAAIGGIEGVIPAVAQAVGFSFYGEGEPRAQLLNYLRRRQLLLILDNFEHLVEDAGLIDEMLRTAPGIKILVTSRVRLHLRPEQRIPVSGMDYPTVVEDLVLVSQHSAVKLFVQCARRVQPDFVLDVGNAGDVVRVCKLVHGMPLGILLATAWLNMLTPAEIAEEIERSLDFLEMDWQAVPARQQSMRAVFDHSWRLLSEREREILCGLSVFRGGCTWKAAEAVTGASLRDLLGLINKSQLHRTPEGRYEMHGLLRQYAAEQLAQQLEDKRQVRDRHCAFFAENLLRWEGELKGWRQHQATAEITAELENIRIAVDRMLVIAVVPWLEHAIDALGLYFEMLNRYQEGAVLCQTIVEGANALTSEDGQRFRAQVLAWQCYFNEQSGDIKRARQIITECLSILGLSGVLNDVFTEPTDPISKSDVRIRAFVYWAAGMCHFDKDIAKQKWFMQQSLALYRRLNDQIGIARLLTFLAETQGCVGDWSECELGIRESLSIAQTLGHYHCMITNYSQLCYVCVSTGRLEEGDMYDNLAQTTAENVGVEASVRISIQRYLVNILLGKFNQAKSDLITEIERYEDQKVSKRLIEAKLGLGVCYRNLGFYIKAYEIALDCYNYCIKEDYLRRGADSSFDLGTTLIAQKHYAEAQNWLECSIAYVHDLGGYRNCEIFTCLGYAAQGLEQLLQARTHFHRAIQLAIRQHLWQIMYHILPGVALLLADLGQLERAVELCAHAHQNSYIANSKWFEDVAGKHIAKAAESLPPEVVTAAQARGRASDVWETAEELLMELSDDAIMS